MKQVGIIGYGRFGKILFDMLKSKYHVKIYDSNHTQNNDVEIVSLEEILKLEIIFIAIPISSFENIIKLISKYKLHSTTIIDMCSVKMYPVEIMEKYLSADVGILACHPHFGPDSYSPFRELKTTLYPIRDIYNLYEEIKSVFESQSIRVVKLTPEEHDKMAASSQGITHFIGRVLNESGVRSTEINTFGFNELLGVIEQTCNDSWDLFKDLQKYNPYTTKMIDKLVDTIETIHNQIKEDAH